MSKTSYTDAELQELEAIILKMNRAKEDLKILQEQISNSTGVVMVITSLTGLRIAMQ